jgi:hypothetical protein
MARLKQPLDEKQAKALTLSGLKKAYAEISSDYKKILDGDYIYCGKCNSFLSRDTFYSSNDYASGKFPVCKKCLMLMATDYDKKTNTYTDNKEKTKETLRFLDLPFIESTYNSALSSVQAEVNEKNRSTAWQQYITMVQSLPNWRGFRWKDSEFEEFSDDNGGMTNRTPRKETYKIFGSGFTNEDYIYLQDQYDDWRSRTQVDSKSQETYITQICFKQLEIWKAQKSGRDTDKLVKSLNDLMNGANLQPRQNVGNAATDSLTFGQLIEKWELTSPIPEPQEEFADPDNIGKFLRVWFKGSLMRALGLDGGYAKEYDDYVSKFSVEKPTNIDGDDSVDESMYEKVFGKEE